MNKESPEFVFIMLGVGLFILIFAIWHHSREKRKLMEKLIENGTPYLILRKMKFKGMTDKESFQYAMLTSIAAVIDDHISRLTDKSKENIHRITFNVLCSFYNGILGHKDFFDTLDTYRIILPKFVNPFDALTIMTRLLTHGHERGYITLLSKNKYFEEYLEYFYPMFVDQCDTQKLNHASHGNQKYHINL